MQNLSRRVFDGFKSLNQKKNSKTKNIEEKKMSGVPRRIKRIKSAAVVQALKKYKIAKPRKSATGKWLTSHPKLSAGMPNGGGGFENQVVRFSHGKSAKLKAGFVSRVKIATSNPNTYIFKSMATNTAPNGTCDYNVTPMLYAYPEIILMQQKISNQSTLKYTIESVSLRTEIVNMDNSQCNMTVYECEARHDIPVSGNNVYTILTQGFTDAGALTTLNGGGIADISATPFQSTEFVEAFKILRSYQLKFNAGEQKVLTLVDKSPCNINMARWQSTGAGQLIQLIQKRSKFLLIKNWGQPAVEALVHTTAGMTGSTLSFSHTLRYDYRWSTDNQSNVYEHLATQGDGLQQTLGALTTPQIIQGQTGVPTSEVAV